MKSLLRSLVLVILAASGLRAATIQITDASLPAGTTVNWTADNVYVLNGFVFVKAGSRLNIEAGTLIKAMEGTGSNASALIVCRGGRIYARGRIDKPIIFTCNSDDPADPAAIGYDPNTTKGLWGGVILCGRAPNNVNGQVLLAEGVPPEFGDLIKYGDSANVLDQTTGLPVDSASRAKNVYDTTGVMQYVSIRHPGSVLAANKEINGLTFCSIGKGTVIDHVEVFNSADDGFEWFGGTVDCKYLVSAFSDDDAFDYDQGYNGRNQFLFAIQNSENGRANRLGEFDSDDGADIPANAGAKPYSKPVWYNCTFVGSGKTSTNTLNDFALIYKENAGGTFINSIVTDFAGYGVKIEDKTGDVDARARLAAGDIVLGSNLFYNMGKGTGNGQISDTAWIRDSLIAHQNSVADPMLRGISRTDNAQLDPRPAAGSPALTASAVAAIPSGDKFLVQTSYRGAFDPNNLWIRGWTLLAQAGYLIPRSANVVDIFADSIQAGHSYTWVSTKEYVLNGFVFVPNGARLTIQPGTVIRGLEGGGSSASALIVCRGGRIYAQGTAESPIIFTALADDVDDPSVLGFDPSTTKGLWGGVILCGRAPNSVNGQVMQAEGVPPEYGDLIKYGDSANAVDQTTGAAINQAIRDKNIYDTTGIMQYVQIRFAGSILAANKEINGLTFCSIGKGTVIDHIEVINSADDGYEWFGGTVDCKYLISAFSDDDAFDYDQGYCGRNQFLFAIQNSQNGRANRLGEFDSDDGADIPSNAGAKPYSAPVWYNCTFIGSGKTSPNTLNDFALIYKENAGGTLANSIIDDFAGYGVKIEDKTGDVDARARLAAGDIAVKNNIFFNMGKGTGDGQISDTAWIRDSLLNRQNSVADPMIANISRTNDGHLIPQPSISGPAFTNVAPVPADGFFNSVNYRGAFGNENWGNGWTYLSTAGFFGDFPTGNRPAIAAKNLPFELAARNVAGKTVIRYSVPQKEKVELAVFSMSGRKVATLANGVHAAGSYQIPQQKTAALGTGLYVLKLTAGEKSATAKLANVK